MIIELLVIFVLGLCIFHYNTRCGRLAHLVNKIPGPRAYPIVGNVPQFWISNPEKLLSIVYKFYYRYYPICRVWGPTWAYINFFQPDDMEVVLNSKNIEKSVFYSFVKSWLGEGLLISKGKKWHTRRKILSPAFHFNILTKYMEVFAKHGASMVVSLMKKNKDQENDLDLNSFFVNLSLSAICEAAMGVSFDTVDPESVKEYREAIMFFGETAVYRLTRPWYLFEFVFTYFSVMGWKRRKALKVLRNFSSKIINERKEYHEKTLGKYLEDLSVVGGGSGEEKDDEVYVGVKRKKLAMLDLLIAASKDDIIDDAGIQEEIDTFIFEGHDTSASALAYTMHLLAEHSEIQNEAREEVNEMWESCDGKLGIAEMNKLPYLERCIKESLRLFPSVPFISRKLTEDVQLKKYLIPADTIGNICVYEMHRDPNFWPEPEKFDPDRFLPENCVGRHPFSYIPFSAGSRNCIGQRFAMLELKTLCAFMLRYFKLETNVKLIEIQRLPDLVLRPTKPIHVKFYPIALK